MPPAVSLEVERLGHCLCRSSAERRSVTAKDDRRFERAQVVQRPDRRRVVVVEVRIEQLRAQPFVSLPRLLRDQGVPGEQDALVRQMEGDVPGRVPRCGYRDGPAGDVEHPVGERADLTDVVDAEPAERQRDREDPQRCPSPPELAGYPPLGYLLGSLTTDVGQLVDVRSDRDAVPVVKPCSAPHVVAMAVGEEQCCHVATGPADPLQRGKQPAPITGPAAVHHRHVCPILEKDPRGVPRPRVVDTGRDLRHLKTGAHPTPCPSRSPSHLAGGSPTHGLRIPLAGRCVWIQGMSPSSRARRTA
jgi:hypothetical protein